VLGGRGDRGEQSCNNKRNFSEHVLRSIILSWPPPAGAPTLHTAPQRFQNGSMNITLKNVPDKVYRAVKRAAKEQGRSLNAQIIQLLEAEAEQLERRKRLPELIKKLERFRKSLPPMDDSTPLIRQERQRR
jgi:hypothetical protein